MINRYATPRHVWEHLRFSAGLVTRRLARIPRPVDVMFSFCDHFEGGELTLTHGEVARWVESYPKIALPHRDHDGRPPRHTWFYLYSDETDNVALLRSLHALCAVDCGEIELHLHHGRGYFAGQPARNVFANVESSVQLRALLNAARSDFQRAGVRHASGDPSETRYAVIHGAWALDNSRWMRGYHGWCGVNNELEILRQTGCFADFTFPAWGTMQPAKINSIYYARDDPRRPKSHNTGIDLRVGGRALHELVIFQGPALGGSDISSQNPPSSKRAADWIRAGVHVRGRPNWIFVKVHTHGCQDPATLDLLLGDGIAVLFSHLEETYNDGVAYRLHYVTAREAYNIAKAAEAGMGGNPDRFRDYVIPRYPITG